MMKTLFYKGLLLVIIWSVVAVACKKDREKDKYETRVGKVWDTTLASTLGRQGTTAADIDPIYLDTNEDDKLNIEGGKAVNFDINGDLVMDVVHEWNTKDAQLVYDANNNGKIDNGREIMNETDVGGEQNKYRNGWEKARAIFDVNNDGIINGGELDQVSVWTDANGNGVADSGELKTAKQAGITSIDTYKLEFVFRKKI